MTKTKRLTVGRRFTPKSIVPKGYVTTVTPTEEIRFDTRPSDLGEVLVAMSGGGIVAILLGNSLEQVIADLHRRFSEAFILQSPLDDIASRVSQYVDAPNGTLDLPLQLRGTAFQQKVWNVVRTIPAGQTSSYSEIALRIGSPKSARAVGSACAKNNHAFAVPCHRVLHKDGSMSWGNAWGQKRQRRLLMLEAAATADHNAQAHSEYAAPPNHKQRRQRLTRS